jgi:hypothetical protein
MAVPLTCRARAVRAAQRLADKSAEVCARARGRLCSRVCARDASVARGGMQAHAADAAAIARERAETDAR